MSKIFLLAALGATLLSPALNIAPAQAQTVLPDKPFLHPLFSENAVLQRDRALTVWGWTTPGQTVIVKLDGAPQTVVAGHDGRWSAPLAPHAAGGPHALEVAGASAGEHAKRENLLFGDVWLCSGQSNMGWSVNQANNADAEKAASANPNIRLLQVPRTIGAAPGETFPRAIWQVCGPETVGKFSAVGYFFGRQLQQELKIPIGLIDSSWGGTPGEAWVSESALQTMGDFNEALASLSAQGATPFEREMAGWWRADPGTQAGWQQPAWNDAAWQSAAEPGAWENRGFADFDGVMWLRREVEVPAAWAGRDLTLNLGAIDDNDTTFWNGTPIGDTTGYNNARQYRVSGAQVKAGRNLIAVRVLDTGGNGGLLADQLSLDLRGSAERISLDGQWKLQPSAALKQLPALPRKTDQNTVTVLYNGMIAPLLPGQIKGAIWYQGESNAGRAAQYQTLLPTLIKDWRARFGAPLPFYIVQLANYRAPDEQPKNDSWPNLQAAQALTARTVPDTGLAVINDIGDAQSIHPLNKQDVGLRLALQALRKTYGADVQADGPTLKTAEPNGDTLVLTFDNARELTLRGDGEHVFALAGADGVYHWATPQIAGNTITLRSPEVPLPATARFAWSNNPRASLYNEAGLPASLFRTDIRVSGSERRIRRVGANAVKLLFTMNSSDWFALLDGFAIEVPSWGFADTGTRFGKFTQSAAAATIEEKIEDAGRVNALTGACPTMAVHVLWDFKEGADPRAVAQMAEEHGIKIGSINPNLFQDQEYKFGSACSPDPQARQMANDHVRDSIQIGEATGSHLLSLWLADGTNYPGQDDLISRKQRLESALMDWHDAMPDSMTMLVEYKPFEPAFYATDIADWGMATLLCQKAGPRAKVLVDTGHHLPGANIEQIVAWLLDEELLGGFHFNDRKYADDDLTLGSIDPYAVFRIFHEIRNAAARGIDVGKIAYMIDQSHNLKPKIEAMIQSVVTAQELYLKASMVDREALSKFQKARDIVGAEECLRGAFFADVSPILQAWRESKGLPADPLRAHRESDYTADKARERSARRPAGSGGSSYA